MRNTPAIARMPYDLSARYVFTELDENIKMIHDTIHELYHRAGERYGVLLSIMSPRIRFGENSVIVELIFPWDDHD